MGVVGSCKINRMVMVEWGRRRKEKEDGRIIKLL
jgi:hypothetical protein